MSPTRQLLSGLKVLSCRQFGRGADLDRRLERLGAEVIRLPLIEVVAPADGGKALGEALDRIDRFDWIACTSVNGVEALSGVELPPGLRLAAVGSATAAAFEEVLGRSALVVPRIATAANLAAAFPERTGTVLAPLAELAGPDLADGLRQRGYRVEVVTAYATRTPEHTAADLDRAAEADVVLITSPSVARRLISVLGERSPAQAVAVGPRSAAAAGELGFSVSETIPDGIETALSELVRGSG
ncbi:MAG: uroporphyrinogen-III synthase [Acidimicrobiales bacterium]|nr:uroporphyrinogen-III synthase [Acidimicrobiales bacterium]